MKLAEEGNIEKGDIVVDQEGIKFIFTGKSFQVLDYESLDKNRYYGLCIGDIWTLTGEYVDIE